ncbi:MAG: FHA domain-containing protein [Gemmatimonadota bacterium]|nr:FHA domain-containing protein [Gemmatimonadota bacterium]
MTVALAADGSLLVESPVDLPEILDLLIVGGGPAGTAAAFRAKELGLACLVLEFDGLLKRIRDYPKDKLILPSFGGGDKMQFPAGGDLVARLYFDPIDKDDMCVKWTEEYRACSVPAKIGVEFTGLERDGDILTATAWNHRTQSREVFRAKHVALALGRGVPRRFDVPGNTEGVSYRLQDAGHYVGKPALVVGGGTSAAEAVIAISNAKIEAEDNTTIHWSYRGSKMPRVSKALADVFFAAYVGNGNIRYHPHSEPTAVVVGPDRAEYVSLRIVRRTDPGKPSETVHLEFPKEDCIACIGEDVPEALLRDLGIHMAVVGEAGKKMMAVSPLLETQIPQVYMIGDLLSQFYLETTDFDASPETFQRMKHKGNIKQAMRDGVFLAEVVAQRLQGREDIAVVIQDAEAPQVPFQSEDPAHTVSFDPSDLPLESFILDRPLLVRITAAGVEEEEYDVRPTGVTTIGQKGCDLSFPDDSLLSENHASIVYREDAILLRDDGGASGTFLKLQPDRPVSLKPESILRLGRQILVLRAGAGGLVFHHYNHRGQYVQEIPLREGTTVLGRAGGKSDPDISLGEDRTLSRFHLSITIADGQALAEDFNSSNGTYLKVAESIEVTEGDVFRVGSQVFRLQVTSHPTKTDSFLRPGPLTQRIEAPTPPPPADVVAEDTPAGPPAEEATAPSPPAATAAQVHFAGLDSPFNISEDESVLEVADENDVDIDYECWCGMCGADLIRIVSGREFLNDVTEKEIKTLKRKGLEPGEYRLACMTKVSGPVRIEVVE